MLEFKRECGDAEMKSRYLTVPVPVDKGVRLIKIAELAKHACSRSWGHASHNRLGANWIDATAIFGGIGDTDEQPCQHEAQSEASQ